MKITERRLRKLIRNVIKESYDTVPSKSGVYTKHEKHIAGNLWDLLDCKEEVSEWLAKAFGEESKPYDILLNKIVFGNYGPDYKFGAGIYYGGYNWLSETEEEDPVLKSGAAVNIVNSIIKDLNLSNKIKNLRSQYEGLENYKKNYKFINLHAQALSGGSGPNNPPVNMSGSGAGPNKPPVNMHGGSGPNRPPVNMSGSGEGPNNPNRSGGSGKGPINLPGSGKGPNNTNYFGGPGGQIKGPKPPTPNPVATNTKRKAKREAHGYIMSYDEAMDFIRDMVTDDSDYRYLRYVLNGSHNAFRNPRNPNYIFNIYVDEMQEMTLGCWVDANQDSYQNARASAERFVKTGTSMTGQFDCSNHMTAIELFVDFRKNYEYGFPRSFA